MVGYVSSVSTSIKDVGSTEITEYAYNFTAPYSDDFYMVLQAETGASKGDFDTVITFSYYEYDPNCVKFTYWNGTSCVVNYNEYCASFTDDVKALYNPESDPDINVTISFNGTDCVVNVASVETVEQIEYIKSNITKEIVIQEIIKRDAGPAEIIYVQDEQSAKDFRSGTR